MTTLKEQVFDLKEGEAINAILKWDQLTRDQKDAAYSESCSHELNTFLMLKDKAYFKSVVQPFVNNKIEKTLVDLFLLNKVDQIGRFLEPESKNQ
jgi:hypothetical protein